MNCDGNLILPQVICCKASYLLAWQDSLHDHHHRGILIEQICKITSLHAPKVSKFVHRFQNIFVFALGPFLPMWVLFFDFNGKMANINKMTKNHFSRSDLGS